MTIKRTLFICAVLLISGALCGCRAAANNAGRLIDGDTIGRPLDSMERAYNPISQDGDNDESREFEEDNRDDEIRAARLKELAEGIDGVTAASVVVNGDAAVIGLSLSGEPGDAAVITIKRRIEREAIQSDPLLKRAAITCQPEMYERVTGEEPLAGDAEEPNDELNHVAPSF
ncbi:MAG: YhcN/YlaJ family sporulation lipoprotein [Clostridiales bacterium]|jgi:hypothetical protein|nr:YhcN/YlaJ family sporulation lipoprotein [Clostridiales bacterium]